MERTEAIEVIRKCWPVNRNGMLSDALETLIPELRESEDERIRKFLVKHVSEWIGCIEHDLRVSPKDVESEKELAMFKAGLAYLEKQKEQQPFMCDGEIEDKKRDIVAAIREYYPADYAAYLTSFLKRLSPEDNSEDEYGQEMLGIAYKLMYEHIPENLRTQEFWDSLKFMREYTGKVAIIHSYEQPAEWSEEDEKAAYFINQFLEYHEASDPTAKSCKEWFNNRLKSLHPDSYKNCNSRWKPSEEQN